MEMKAFPCVEPLQENIGSSDEGLASVASSSLCLSNPVCTDEHRARMFQDIASGLINCTHDFFVQVTHLPFPIGPIVQLVEEILNPWTHYCVETLEAGSLKIGATVDDQIYAVRASLERCLNNTSATVQSVSPVLCKRGFIGLSADLWINYEGCLKEQMQRAVDFADEFPGLNLITPIICAVSAPLARAITDFCVKHSEAQEKDVQTSEKTDATAMLTVKHSEPEEKVIPTENAECEDVKHSEPEEKVIPTYGEQRTLVTQDAESEAEQKEVKKYVAELGILLKEQGAAADVLEMLDSGWSMGVDNTSRKKPVKPSKSYFSSWSSRF